MFMTAVNQLFKVRYLLYIFLYIATLPVYAQQRKGHAVQANIIYHFTKYINWPGHMKSGDFVIGVIGEPHLAEELEKAVARKTAGSQRIVVQLFNTGESQYPCHILFLADAESNYLKKLVAATSDQPVLLVSETEGAAHRGSCINFVIVDDRLRLEINKTNIDKRNLSIATELLQLGKVIK
jgi:hypothetical protein